MRAPDLERTTLEGWRAVVSLLVLFAQSGCHSHDENAHGDEGHSHEADGGTGHGDVPHEYEGLHNPYATDVNAVESGEALYAQHCARCHGADGAGQGSDADNLDPMPSGLTGEHVQDASDAYLFYRISDGGSAPFNSAMPAFEGILTEDERWQLVAFVRSLAGGHADGD